MVARTLFPSPLRGEGYGALAPKALRRSWMRVSEPLARAIAWRSHTPHPASTSEQARKSAQPSPARGEGLW
ncbi:MAG: hypothetical protein CVT78_04615 [Alphaproteobacteria bacterium HGW-Alphaproteobacteria-17]|nr:MAG: hypothetical protein CVT78_04615 [Alphaproteobacteria bacterium HGW-Alphaproteobacteria-17]